MTQPTEDRTDLIDEIDALALQARSIALGLSFALNAQEGEPARDIVQGMLSSITSTLDLILDAMEDLTAVTATA